jgi:hypothetical protein
MFDFTLDGLFRSTTNRRGSWLQSLAFSSRSARRSSFDWTSLRVQRFQIAAYQNHWFYWFVVGIPLAWGIWNTLLKLPALFR